MSIRPVAYGQLAADMGVGAPSVRARAAPGESEADGQHHGGRGRVADPHRQKGRDQPSAAMTRTGRPPTTAWTGTPGPAAGPADGPSWRWQHEAADEEENNRIGKRRQGRPGVGDAQEDREQRAQQRRDGQRDRLGHPQHGDGSQHRTEGRAFVGEVRPGEQYVAAPAAGARMNPSRRRQASKRSSACDMASVPSAGPSTSVGWIDMRSPPASSPRMIAGDGNPMLRRSPLPQGPLELVRQWRTRRSVGDAGAAAGEWRTTKPDPTAPDRA